MRGLLSLSVALLSGCAVASPSFHKSGLGKRHVTPTAAALESVGSTVKLGDIRYYVPGTPTTTLNISGSMAASWMTGDLVPFTVITSNTTTFTADSLDAVASMFSSTDDVWTTDFLDNVLLQPANATADSSLTSMITFMSAPSSTLPQGPYFFRVVGSSLKVYEAYRMYPDEQQAFFYGILPTTDGAFQTLSATLPGHDGVAAIGVPSRLYFTPTAAKPLAGVRIAVKDLYDLKGLKTSMGNRAWDAFYPPVNSTAPAIQYLIDQGALIVGKCRLSQFANGEYGTADNVDYHTPFNIRGDGYQDPSSSSSGSGAAVGSYGWLDFTIGSDTGGSVRAPAGVNAAYGNRPSQGALTLEGVLPLSPPMDTAAMMAEDAYKFVKYAKAWYGMNSTFNSLAPPGTPFPKKLLYPINPNSSYANPGFWPADNNASIPLYEAFVQKLEGFLGVNRTILDFYNTSIDALGGAPPDVVGPVWSAMTAYDQYQLVHKGFFANYSAAHDGRLPFVDPPVQLNIEYGRNLTAANYSTQIADKGRFQAWIQNDIFPRNSTSCSGALMVYPLAEGDPSDKSLYHLASTIYNGWDKYGISQLAGVPELVIPFGQVPYASPITNTTVYLPISVSILTAHGCDFQLYDLLEALTDAGIVKNDIIPGSSNAFPL